MLLVNGLTLRMGAGDLAEYSICLDQTFSSCALKLFRVGALTTAGGSKSVTRYAK